MGPGCCRGGTNKLEPWNLNRNGPTCTTCPNPLRQRGTRAPFSVFLLRMGRALRGLEMKAHRAGGPFLSFRSAGGRDAVGHQTLRSYTTSPLACFASFSELTPSTPSTARMKTLATIFTAKPHDRGGRTGSVLSSTRSGTGRDGTPPLT